MPNFASVSDSLAVPGLVVNIAVLLLTGGSLVVAVLSARKKVPSFRLDSITVDPWSGIDGSWRDDNNPLPVTLTFVNDGPGLAPATNVLVTGIPSVPPEIRFPADGRPTIPVGGSISFTTSAIRMPADDPWPERNFNQGDDIRLDLRGHRVTFEWQAGRSGERATGEDVHTVQRRVPVLIADRPTGTLFTRPDLH